MYSQKIYHRLAVLTTLLLAISPAWAHASHDHAGLWAGLTHPFSGLDHILAMFGIGVWAGSGKIAFNKHQVLVLGLACLTGVTFLLAVFTALPAFPLEWLLAGSVLVAGLLVLFAARLPFWSTTFLAGFLIASHACAHFIEMPAALQASTYASAGYIGGFALTTAVLFLSGAITAWGFEKLFVARGLPFTGGVLAVCGLYLLTAV